MAEQLEQKLERKLSLPAEVCLNEVPSISLRQKTFLSQIYEQIKQTGNAYKLVAKNPKLIPIGLYEVAKDTLFELPKSLINRGKNKLSKNKSSEQRLDEALSQSFVIPIAGGLPGTYAGIHAAKLLGADDYSATLIGGTIGNYISAVASFIAAYVGLSRGVKDYPAKQALKDSLKMVRDYLPIAIANYIAVSPVTSAELALGLTPNQAVSINYPLFSSISIGIGKQVLRQEISAKNGGK